MQSAPAVPPATDELLSADNEVGRPTDLTRDNCWFVAYRGGQGLFTAHTLAEAEEALKAAMNVEGRA
jgi:hypothetical protein